MNTATLFGVGLAGLSGLAIPFTYALAATFVAKAEPFRRASFAATTALLWAALAACALVWGPRDGAVTFTAVATSAHPLGQIIRFDAVASVMLALVSFIAFIIVRFSSAYLRGDSGQVRYVRWLMGTLAAVALLILANNLLLMAAAWVATSLCLHQLLTFYAQRPQAQVAAHKKFLVSRVADLCLFGGIALIHAHVGSLNLDDTAAWANNLDSLPYGVHAATVLFVVAAALKCAQLPFHGWLTQVMEAPTPVSALLHAGVVNIGGFMMIRLAPVMIKAEAAQTLLVLIGCTTAVVAALVMTTRVSVKVALAWSTCAQMGFMLVQCGLGVYHLALLHIVAHSLYKAHAFLSSGSAVDQWRINTLVTARPPLGMRHWLTAALTGLIAVFAVGTALGADALMNSAFWAMGLVLGLALTPLLARTTGCDWEAAFSISLRSLAVAALYFTWHRGFGPLVESHSGSGALPLRLFIVGLSFIGLFLVQAVMQVKPQGRLARALYPRLYAGLHLDEFFTRLTFRLWPPHMPAQTISSNALHTELRKA